MRDGAADGQGLERRIGLFSATILVIANMVGTGIFTTSGFIMAELESPRYLLLAWGVGALFALSGALSYSELCVRFPHAGGEYVFLRESLGRPFGFLTGWISLIVGFSAPIAASALAFSSYLFRIFPVSPGNLPLSGAAAICSPHNLTAVGVIVLISLIHCHGVGLGSRIQNSLTLFKIALVVLFIGCAFLFGTGFPGNPTVMETPPPFVAEKFAVSLIFVSFAYSGWNAAAYLGSEIINPKRNIPLALITGTLVVSALYLLLNSVYLYALPPDAMKNVLEIGAVAAVSLFGEPVSRLFSAAVSIGLLSVLSAMILTGPRIYYAMARDGLFFKRFGHVNPERKTPQQAICLQAGIAILMVITAAFDTLLIYIGFTLSLFATLTVLGLMRLRLGGPRPQEGIPYKTIGYPLTPLFFILGNLWIIFFSIKERPVAALIGLGTICLGALAYAFFNRKSRAERSG